MITFTGKSIHILDQYEEKTRVIAIIVTEDEYKKQQLDDILLIQKDNSVDITIQTRG